MIDFKMNSNHNFGLPERSAKFLLEETLETGPYRLYSLDVFPHKEWDPRALYSGIPYITAHHENHDESIAWITASETFVDMIKYHIDA